MQLFLEQLSPDSLKRDLGASHLLQRIKIQSQPFLRSNGETLKSHSGYTKLPAQHFYLIISSYLCQLARCIDWPWSCYSKILAIVMQMMTQKII